MTIIYARRQGRASQYHYCGVDLDVQNNEISSNWLITGKMWVENFEPPHNLRCHNLKDAVFCLKIKYNDVEDIINYINDRFNCLTDQNKEYQDNLLKFTNFFIRCGIIQGIPENTPLEQFESLWLESKFKSDKRLLDAVNPPKQIITSFKRARL